MRNAPALALAFSLAAAAACHHDAGTSAAPGTPRVAITVDASGYHPSSVTTPANRPVTLVFTRTSDEGCGQQVVFPSLHIQRDLPLNEPVAITVTPPIGTLAFTCGMDMLRGSVVAQ